jgi:hypothetical protein
MDMWGQWEVPIAFISILVQGETALTASFLVMGELARYLTAGSRFIIFFLQISFGYSSNCAIL